MFTNNFDETSFVYVCLTLYQHYWAVIIWLLPLVYMTSLHQWCTHHSGKPLTSNSCACICTRTCPIKVPLTSVPCIENASVLRLYDVSHFPKWWPYGHAWRFMLLSASHRGRCCQHNSPCSRRFTLLILSLQPDFSRNNKSATFDVNNPLACLKMSRKLLLDLV